MYRTEKKQKETKKTTGCGKGRRDGARAEGDDGRRGRVAPVVLGTKNKEKRSDRRMQKRKAAQTKTKGVGKILWRLQAGVDSKFAEMLDFCNMPAQRQR